jgi:hypothetical protein
VSDLLPFVVIAVLGAVTGVVIGMLVAPIVGRLAGEDRPEADGDGNDEPA